jgi:spore photoproduct lyase
MQAEAVISSQQINKKWYPKKIIITADALKYQFGESIYERIRNLGIDIVESPANRITGIKGKTDAETYRNAKSTLAIVAAPPGQFRLQPIPPSADYQFHLAQGCPAHCQYCYLAGSLQGPPVVRAYANIEEILNNTALYDRDNKITSFEASCYTDPLALEHLTGSLSETIKHFGRREKAHLRWVTKFDDVTPLLDLSHNKRTRCRISFNAAEIIRHFEAGTASLEQRLIALGKLIDHGYPVGIVMAPIIPVADWERIYETLFQRLANTIPAHTDLTIEFITHRFTPGSKDILTGWYPNTKLPFDEDDRSRKFNKFGGVKYVYKQDTMKEMKHHFFALQKRYLPTGEVLYWT